MKPLEQNDHLVLSQQTSEINNMCFFQLEEEVE